MEDIVIDAVRTSRSLSIIRSFSIPRGVSFDRVTVVRGRGPSPDCCCFDLMLSFQLDRVQHFSRLQENG